VLDSLGQLCLFFALMWGIAWYRQKDNIKAAINSPLGQAAKKKGMEWLIGRLFKR